MKFSIKLSLFFLSFLSHSLFGVITWGSASSLSDSDFNAVNPVLHMSYSTGEAIAAWQFFDGSNTRIQASIFDGDSWSIPTILSSSSLDCDKPQVAINDQGHAIAIWRCNSSVSENIIEAAFYNGSSWSSADTLSEISTNDAPSLAINPSSDSAIAVWRESRGIGELKTAIFNGSTWAIILGFSPTASPVDTNININGNGQGVLTWISGDNIRTLHAAVYDSEWSSAFTLSESGKAVIQSDDTIAPGANRGGAIWSELNMVKAMFWNGSAWVNRQTLSEEIFLIDPKITFHPTELQMAAIWRGSAGIQGSVFSSNTWGDFITIATEGTNPDLAYNSADNTIGVVWKAGSFIKFATFSPSSVSQPINLSSENTSLSFPFIQIDSNGNAIAVWSMLGENGNNIIRASRGIAP